MILKTLLWLDDYRNPFDTEIDWMVFSPINRSVNVYWVKSYNEFIQWITKYGLPDAICFDNDLGNADKMDGIDCAKWLVNYCLDNNCNIPAYNVQSANPVGKENIINLLENFKKNYEI